jgi:hypothetical protein
LLVKVASSRILLSQLLPVKHVSLGATSAPMIQTASSAKIILHFWTTSVSHAVQIVIFAMIRGYANFAAPAFTLTIKKHAPNAQINWKTVSHVQAHICATDAPMATTSTTT